MTNEIQCELIANTLTDSSYVIPKTFRVVAKTLSNVKLQYFAIEYKI